MFAEGKRITVTWPTWTLQRLELAKSDPILCATAITSPWAASTRHHALLHSKIISNTRSCWCTHSFSKNCCIYFDCERDKLFNNVSLILDNACKCKYRAIVSEHVLAQRSSFLSWTVDCSSLSTAEDSPSTLFSECRYFTLWHYYLQPHGLHTSWHPSRTREPLGLFFFSHLYLRHSLILN